MEVEGSLGSSIYGMWFSVDILALLELGSAMYVCTSVLNWEMAKEQ